MESAAKLIDAAHRAYSNRSGLELSELRANSGLEREEVFDALTKLDAALKTGVAANVVTADGAFLQRADAALTKVQKDRGDRADIAQMIEWEKELLRGKYANAGCDTAFNLNDTRYRIVVEELAACATKILGAPFDVSSSNLNELERTHREILLRLSGY